MPPSGPPSPLAIAGIGRARHGAGLIRRLQHEGIERARGLDRLEMRVGQFKRGKGFVREAVSGLGERQRCQIGHLSTGLQKNGDSVLSLAGSSRFASPRLVGGLQLIEHGIHRLVGIGGLALALHGVEIFM